MQMLGSRSGMGGGDAAGAGGAPEYASRPASAGAGSAAKPTPSKGGAAKFDDMDDDIPF
jgi:single-strand DNA-binding protein